ncbi:MAG TPA: hypothetical protein VIL98_00285 [Gaiellaceae bacterium]
MGIAPEIAPDTGMGAVELTVADLDRTLDYWQREIGLRVLLPPAGLRTSTVLHSRTLHDPRLT